MFAHSLYRAGWGGGWFVVVVILYTLGVVSRERYIAPAAIHDSTNDIKNSHAVAPPAGPLSKNARFSQRPIAADIPETIAAQVAPPCAKTFSLTCL